MKSFRCVQENFEGLNARWPRDSVGSIGVKFTQKLSRALWYLDTHHDKFMSRGIPLPPVLGSLQGYNDFRRKKEKEPRLSVESFEHHIQQLTDSLMQPWFLQKAFDPLRNEVGILVDAMHKYCEYLKDKSSKVTEHHQLVAFEHSDNATLVVIDAVSGPPLPEYASVEEALRPLPLYSPVCLHPMKGLHVGSG